MWYKAVVIIGLTSVLLFLFSLSPVTAQGGNGTLTGYVINLTQDGGSVDQVDVTLNAYVTDAQLTPMTTTTDIEGKFEFTGLKTEVDYIYQLGLDYGGAEYLYQAFTFPQEDIVKNAKLIVYDSTSSDQYISVDRSHVIVDVQTGSLNVTEYYLFANGANTTYIGSDQMQSGLRETLRFSFPLQATDLSLGGELNEWSTVIREDGFADTMVFLPGTKEILFSYKLDYSSGSYSLPLSLHYPVNSFDLMVQGEKVEVICDQLTPMELPNQGDQTIIYYAGRNLDRNTTMEISFSGLSSSAGGGLAWQFVVTIALAHIMGISLLVWWRRRRARRLVVQEGQEFIPTHEKLLQEIASLDDDFERGNISKEDYLNRRSLMKAQLIEILQKKRNHKNV